MEPTCYRCHAPVEPDANYCLSCGAPQIRFVPDHHIEAQPAEATHRSPSEIEHTGLIAWKPAIQIAISVAIIVGILSTVMAIGSILWVALGAMLAIRVYRRRQPQPSLSKRAGAHIGALVGALAATVALAGNAIFLVIQRYGLHQGAALDQQMTEIIHQAATRAGAMDPQAPVQVFVQFWLSAEGRVGLMLLAMGFLCLFILLFAIAGGVLGAQIYRSPNGRKVIP